LEGLVLPGYGSGGRTEPRLTEPHGKEKKPAPPEILPGALWRVFQAGVLLFSRGDQSRTGTLRALVSGHVGVGASMAVLPGFDQIAQTVDEVAMVLGGFRKIGRELVLEGSYPSLEILPYSVEHH